MMFYTRKVNRHDDGSLLADTWCKFNSMPQYSSVLNRIFLGLIIYYRIEDCPSRLVNPRFVSNSLQHPLASFQTGHKNKANQDEYR